MLSRRQQTQTTGHGEDMPKTLRKNIRNRRQPWLNIARLTQLEVAADYARLLDAALPAEGYLDEVLHQDCWDTIITAINSVAENAIGHVERTRRNEWFNEECRRTMVEENACAGGSSAKKHPPKCGKSPTVDKLHRSQETRTFYQKLNAFRKGFELQAEMCRDKDEGILTDNREVVKSRKQHFDKHLNGVHAGDQDGGGSYIAGVVNDEEEPVPTMSEIKEAVRQQNSNKSAGKDGIAAVLIKMGLDKLVDCLHRLMVRIWDSYRGSGRMGLYGLSTRRVTNWTVRTTDRSLSSTPRANRFVGSHQPGFMKGRSTMDQIFTLRQMDQIFTLRQIREHQVLSTIFSSTSKPHKTRSTVTSYEKSGMRRERIFR